MLETEKKLACHQQATSVLSECFATADIATKPSRGPAPPGSPGSERPEFANFSQEIKSQGAAA